MDIYSGQSREEREQDSRAGMSGAGQNERPFCKPRQPSGEGVPELAREEWDFSMVPAEEWMPALIWEMHREFEPAEGETGKLEAEFGADVSLLLKAFARPWSCLPEELRRLMANSYHYTQGRRIVSVVSGSAGGVPSDRKETPGESDNPARTTISLMIDWTYSRKRILARVAGILKRLEPANVARLNLRGRKDRDTIVELERVGIMRLLHHYTLSEIKRMIPEAWRRYRTRKWYHDRRRVLKDFRAIVRPREAERCFPRSWRTKGQA